MTTSTAETGARRRKLKSVLQSLADRQKKDREQYSRQVPYDDVFQTYYDQKTATILRPAYSPEKMYKLYEENGVVKSSVEAYIENIDGFGHEIVAIDGVEGESDQTAHDPEKVMLEEFFQAPNDQESMITLRKQLRRDYMVTGNAFMEVVRDREGKPFAVFWADAKRTRVCKITPTVTVEITLRRRGMEVTVPIERTFRKFAMLHPSSVDKVRYFKEYGDPRVMNALTGEFLTEINPDDVTSGKVELATEIKHIKHGNDVYGIPPWVGTIMAAMGMAKADFVNYDLFDSQGIPPLMVLLSGGQLTDESFNDIVDMFRKAKGSENFNKLLILEAESTTTSLDGRETPAKIEVKGLTETRKEDAMFLSYLEDSRESIRKFGFRLPGMFLGATKDEKHETAIVARMIAEEQIFSPLRRDFDEVINTTLVKDLGATKFRFSSLGPVMQSNADVLTLIPVLIESGVFTVNQLIAFVNNTFNLTLEPYEEEWANEPIKPVGQAAVDMAGNMFNATTPSDQNGGKDMKEKNDKVYKALQELEEIAARYVLKGCTNVGCQCSH